MALMSSEDWTSFKERGVLSLSISYALAAAFVYLLPTYVLLPNWTWIVSLFPSPLYCFVLGSASMNFGLTVVLNIVLGFLYWAQFEFIEKYKINRDQKWPWLSPHADVRDKFWNALPWSMARVLLNNIMVLPSLVFTYSNIASRIGAFSTEVHEFPTTWTLVWQIAICCVVEDAMFYLSHRTLHHPRIYQYVHKIHHEYHHPIALASEHAHPIEFFLGNLLPVVTGPLLLRCHMATLWLWILVRIGVSIDEHSGYAFPWVPVRLLPFGASAEGHDYHHNQNKDAMFSSQFTWWDTVCGTEVGYHEWKESRRNKTKMAPMNNKKGE